MANALSSSLLLFVTTLLSFVSAQQCETSTNTIADLEAFVSHETKRTYTICPDHSFVLGNLNYHNEIVVGDQKFASITLQSNLHIKCGSDGASSNNCIFRNGDIHVDGTNRYSKSKTDYTLDNVLLEGLTFTSAATHMVVINKPGTVTFRDCEFKNSHRALEPILLDYYDSKNPTSELVVVFENCKFSRNEYAGESANPAFIINNSRQVRIIIDSCTFVQNDMTANNTMKDDTSLIESYGPLAIMRSCFEDNFVGASPVVVYNKEHKFFDNYGVTNSSSTCAFASYYATSNQVRRNAPMCEDFDASSCLAKSVVKADLLYANDTFVPSDYDTIDYMQTFDFVLVESTTVTSNSTTTNTTMKPTESPSLMFSYGPTFMPTILSTYESSFASDMPSDQESDVPTEQPYSLYIESTMPTLQMEDSDMPTIVATEAEVTASPTAKDTLSPTAEDTLSPTSAKATLSPSAEATEALLLPTNVISIGFESAVESSSICFCGSIAYGIVTSLVVTTATLLL